MKYPISLDLLLDANAWWSKWFRKKMVPAMVSPEVMDFTCPPGVRDNRVYGEGGNCVVASAEQSFLQLEKDGELEPGEWMAITPCYRDEMVLDEEHLPVFLKLELFRYSRKKVFMDAEAWILAERFREFLFEIHSLPTEIVKTEIGWDVVYEDLELGSFGVRETMRGYSYTYGTGLAEPRTSTALLRYREKYQSSFD